MNHADPVPYMPRLLLWIANEAEASKLQRPYKQLANTKWPKKSATGRGSGLALGDKMDNLGERSAVRNAGLFLVLAIIFNGLIFPDSPSAGGAAGTFYLVFFVHAGFTLYDGRFGRLRSVTWLLLTGLLAWGMLSLFLGYVLIWGQMSYWLVNILTNLLPDPMVLWDPAYSGPWRWIRWIFQAVAVIIALLPLALLCLDIAVMHYDSWRRVPKWRAAVFAAFACLAGLALGFMLGALAPQPAPVMTTRFPTPAHIVPEWYWLPDYAILRAIPSKLGGVIAMFCAMLLPLLWPWMRADALRTGPMRRVWALLCLLLACTWIGLGYLGSLPAEGADLHITRVLTVYYFAFFLILPPLLHRIARSPG
jgi:hypothetical protein